MLTRIMILIAATLAVATPAIAQRSGEMLGARGVGNFGPSSASIGQANPGAQALARPTDPSQGRDHPGAPSTASTPVVPAVPSTPLLPNSNGIGQ